MKKIIIFLITFVIFMSLFTILMLQASKISYVAIDGKKFLVDVAKTNEQQAKGLSIYNKLPAARGMIFPFKSPGEYSFWMKGMKFPIDIIYISNNRISNIFQNLPYPKSSTDTPVIVKPTTNANYVLEINSGLSQKYNFKTGDTVLIKL